MSDWRNPAPQKEETNRCEESVVCWVPCCARWTFNFTRSLKPYNDLGKCCPHFSDEKTKAQRLSNLPKVTQLPKDPYSRPVWLQKGAVFIFTCLQMKVFLGEVGDGWLMPSFHTCSQDSAHFGSQPSYPSCQNYAPDPWRSVEGASVLWKEYYIYGKTVI